MRAFSHFTVRRAREGDPPAEPLPHRPPNVTPAKARQEPRPPARLTHAHCPPPTAHCIRHSSFENSSLPLRLLLPLLATRNSLLATAFLPTPGPSAPCACPNPLAKPLAKPLFFQPPTPCDRQVENNQKMQNKPRFVAMQRTQSSSFPASGSKLAARNSPPYALLNAILRTARETKLGFHHRVHSPAAGRNHSGEMSVVYEQLYEIFAARGEVDG